MHYLFSNSDDVFLFTLKYNFIYSHTINSQDSLILEATADGLSGEQTWPSEAEMNIGDAAAAAADNMDSNIGRNRRIVPTNVRYFCPFVHFLFTF